MGQEIFPIMRGGAGMGQEKSMRGGGEDPILRPRLAPLPSLLTSTHAKAIQNAKKGKAQFIETITKITPS